MVTVISSLYVRGHFELSIVYTCSYQSTYLLTKQAKALRLGEKGFDNISYAIVVLRVSYAAVYALPACMIGLVCGQLS